MNKYLDGRHMTGLQDNVCLTCIVLFMSQFQKLKLCSRLHGKMFDFEI